MKYRLENSGKIGFGTSIGENDDLNSDIPNRLIYLYYIVTDTDKFEVMFSIVKSKADRFSIQVEKKLIYNICESIGIDIDEGLSKLTDDLMEAVIKDYVELFPILRHSFFLRKEIGFSNVDKDTNIITAFVGDYVTILPDMDNNIIISCNNLRIKYKYTYDKENIKERLYDFIDKYNQYIAKNLMDVMISDYNLLDKTKPSKGHMRYLNSRFDKSIKNKIVQYINPMPEWNHEKALEELNSTLMAFAFKMSSGRYCNRKSFLIQEEDAGILYN